MAKVLPSPDQVPQGVSTGYQAQNTILFASMVGFSMITIQNNTVQEGSIFEINGSLVRVINNETIQGLNTIPADTILYIYAVPVSSDDTKFIASTVSPVWNPVKSGWYNTSVNGRALIKATKNDVNDLIGVVRMNEIVTNVNPDAAGGTLFFTRNTKGQETIHQQPGWVRFELASGAGEGDGESVTVNTHVGGAGGGSGAGEESYIVVANGTQKYSTKKVKPGNGGNGRGGSINPDTYKGGKGIFEDMASYFIFNVPIDNEEKHYESWEHFKNSFYEIGVGQQGLAIASTISSQFQFTAKTFAGVKTIDSANKGNGGTPGKGWGGGGGASGNVAVNSISGAKLTGNGGGVAAKHIQLNGCFYHPGGVIEVYIGGNGYNGGNGGASVADGDTYLGGNGGGGGAPGWFRPIGDAAAGYCNLYYIGH